MNHPLVFAAGPSNDIGIDPSQGRTQPRPVEVAVVGDPAADQRIVLLGQLVKQTADALGVATSTVHRWLNDGIIAGEQLTPGAPWRIRLTDNVRARVAEEVPEGYLTMYQTMRLLGVSRQSVWQRVKRGEIEAVHVRCGRKNGLRLKLIHSQPDLFNQAS
jgi:predicted DNA-binding transcriptional regulator AlpA